MNYSPANSSETLQDADCFPQAVIPDIRSICLNKAALRRLRWFYQRSQSKHRSQCDNVDLDLVRVGAVNLIQGRSSEYLTITRVGVQLLAEELERARLAKAPHDSLAERLARHLRSRDRITWLNIEFRAAPGLFVRPDVYSVVPTFSESRLCPMVHEVKVSRSDFLADVARPQKRAGYGYIACYVQYCVPDGMVDPSEVPDECGLVVEKGDGNFATVRRGLRRNVALSPRHYMNMVLKQSTSDDVGEPR